MKTVFLIFVFAISSLQCIACMCSGASEYTRGERTIEWWNEHEYIFKAKLDSLITLDRFNQRLYFSLTKDYKGEVAKHINFLSPGYGTSCQWSIEDKIGQEFILYGYIDENRDIASHFCQGSKTIISSEEIDSIYENDYSHILHNQEMKFLKDIEKEKSGNVKTYYSNGKLTGIGKFKNYKPIGYWKYYTIKGQIKSEGKYKNYQKHGTWIEYNYSQERYITENNQTKYKLVLKGYQKGKYTNGVKSDNWKSFTVDGQLIE